MPTFWALWRNYVYLLFIQSINLFGMEGAGIGGKGKIERKKKNPNSLENQLRTSEAKNVPWKGLTRVMCLILGMRVVGDLLAANCFRKNSKWWETRNCLHKVDVRAKRTSERANGQAIKWLNRLPNRCWTNDRKFRRVEALYIVPLCSARLCITYTYGIYVAM